MDALMQPEFWIAVGQIILIDILLGGDNAVVIALACRKLPPAQRTQGILWGTAGAIVLRIILIFFALTLLAIPFLKIVGAVLLLWIGVKLLVPDHGDGHDNIEGSDKLWGAVKTVIIADLVMSVDNVIAIAGAAETAGGGQHSMALVIFGVLVSIPIIVWGSQLVIKLMDRFPVIITLGGMLLGWIAGTMFVTDPALLNPDIVTQMPKLQASDTIRYGAGIAGALLVLLIGKWVARRSPTSEATQAGPATETPGGRWRNVLVAVDGSGESVHAVRQALSLRSQMQDPAALHLHVVNVQRPVTADVGRFVATQSLQEYQQERSDEAFAPARAALADSGAKFTEHARIGVPGPVIADLARSENCDLIVMGSRGLGGHAAALLGSVAQAVIEHATVPVLIAK
jgi:YjbE family integral membrane protein